MRTIRIEVTDEDYAAFERAARDAQELTIYFISAELHGLARRIRAQEAIDRGDGPCEWGDK